MGFTASQIRQDLNCFGGFGQQGYGYNVEQLYKEIGSILGVNNHLKTILIGAGNLGHAIASHMSFEARGFNLIGIFDKNEALAGKLVRNIPVRHINGLYDFVATTPLPLQCFVYQAIMQKKLLMSLLNSV